MRALPSKFKPTHGFSHYFHLGLISFLPAILFVLVRIDFVQLAFALILLSKWRMFVVRPRYWLANINANAVDIMVGASLLVFMDYTTSFGLQLFWAAVYGVWLIFIKPRSSTFMVSVQALLSQGLALVALYTAWTTAPTLGIVVATWLIGYWSARHFLSNFEDQYTSLYAHAWAYFAAALTWILSHWLLFYGTIPQPALLLTVISFGLGGLYFLDEAERLTALIRRQVIFIMSAIILVVLVFSDWGDKTL